MNQGLNLETPVLWLTQYNFGLKKNNAPSVLLEDLKMASVINKKTCIVSLETWDFVAYGNTLFSSFK